MPLVLLFIPLKAPCKHDASLSLGLTMSFFKKAKIKPYWREVEQGELLKVGDRFLLDDNKTHDYLTERNLCFGDAARTMSAQHKPHQRLTN